MSYFSNLGVSDKYYCKFIPPFILENLARAGVEDAALTIKQDRLNRMERASTVPDVAKHMGATPMGISARQIYDSQNKWEFQVKLVRDEGSPITGDDAVDSAYDCIGNLLDYFKNKLNRKSLDNMGDGHNMQHSLRRKVQWSIF